jgi:uncharacterized protein YbjT (DUF2867 family)
MRVVVAGATGFVGQALLKRLQGRVELIGLSRRARDSSEHVSFRACDLFSLLKTERALEGADVAVYLVHSMLPQARLTQGSFQDLDLLLADNFARAARKAGVPRIVYLGGIVPEGAALSAHIASRLEVERALSAHGVPVVALRAGLVLGPGGSSFEMMLRLVRRLPVMICPRWTTTLGQPVALDDVLDVLERAVLDDALPSGAYDVAGPDRLSYVDLMRMTGEKLGLKRRFIPLSVFTVGLSLLWLRLVTGAPRQLAAPLVQSLKHPMLARDRRIFERYALDPMPISEALDRALDADRHASPSVSRLAALHELRRASPKSCVYSVQRMRLPPGQRARSVARRYAAWLMQLLGPLLRVYVDGQGSLSFVLCVGKKRTLTLLTLTHAKERSTEDRELYYITGGLLVDRDAEPGRFEFREVRGRDELITAVYDFAPALPWQLYRVTQAPLHLWIMRAFARHLLESDEIDVDAYRLER